MSGASRRRLAIAGALGMFAVGPYVRSLGAGFYSDDYEWLGRMAPTLENPLYVFRIFYRDFNPVLHVSFLLDFLAGGGSPVAYHATSLLVHGLCAALLALLAYRFTSRDWIVVAAVATWALNSRLSEAVIWPAARGHSLATLFVLAGMLALGSRSRQGRWSSVPLFVLALLSKETALFPIVLAPLFVDGPKRCRGLLATIYASAIAFVAFNVLFKPELHLSPASPWFLVRKVPFLLLRPLGLGDLYDFGVPSFLAASLLLGAAAIALLWTPARAGVLWIGLCLVPIAPLDKLSSRYLYLPSIGYALILCGVFEPLWERLRLLSTRRLTLVGGAAVTLSILVADIGRIQREIGDYAMLSKPYDACLESLRSTATSLQPHETLVLYDLSPRDAPARLQQQVRERETMSKLIPLRQDAVGGLIHLVDAVNAYRVADGGLVARTVESTEPGTKRFVVYDGRTVRSLDAAIPSEVDADRVFAVRLEPSNR